MMSTIIKHMISKCVSAWQDCKDIPAVQNLLARAREVLGYDLLQLCLEGPKEKLDDTAFSQPALYVAGTLQPLMDAHVLT